VSENKDDHADIAAETANRLIGTKLGGQYTIVGVLGAGGLGTIFRAHQETVDRWVAIKFLPSSLAKDQVIVKRMAREGKALGRLNHPNIVTTYDFGFTERREPYLVLELVDGETLQAYLDRLGPMPVATSLPVFIQLSDAMKYAHANGVVHRDLKPHNIMLVQKDGKTVVKILDFGIAQMESEGQKLTLQGEIWGSPHYMSPEQCSAENVDHLTDIYSLGIVMYCTLSAQLPHNGTSFAEVVSQKLFEPIPSLITLNLPHPIDVPLSLERIVFKCLRRQRVERYQSMAELQEALETFAKEAKIIDDSSIASAAGSRSAGAPAPNTDGASGQKKARSLVLPVVVVLAVLMVAALATLISIALRSQPLKSPLQSPTAVARPLLLPAQSGSSVVVPEKAQQDAQKQPEGQGKKEITPAPDGDKSTSDHESKQAGEKPAKPGVDEETKPAEPGANGETKLAVPIEMPTPDSKPLPKDGRRARASVSHLNQGAPSTKVEDSTSGGSPTHHRESDPNSFYRDWGGVKDAQ
jgi:serine/threonine-protein kinase